MQQLPMIFRNSDLISDYQRFATDARTPGVRGPDAFRTRTVSRTFCNISPGPVRKANARRSSQAPGEPIHPGETCTRFDQKGTVRIRASEKV